MSAERVAIGVVSKAHGIRGEVVVVPQTDLPGRFDPGAVITLVTGSRRRDIRIEASRPHQGRVLVKLEGVADRSEAELLRGSVIEADRADTDDLDVYMADELLGARVRHTDGRDLGTVAAFIDLPEAAGYDLLEVAYGDQTWLLPATDDYVDVEEGPSDELVLVVVDPPEGLLPDFLDA